MFIGSIYRFALAGSYGRITLMKNIVIGEVSWERMVRAVEKVRERLLRAARALDKAGIAYAVLGGMTTWVGPIVGATVLTALPEVLRPLKDQREVVNGLLLMLSIIYLPRGLADPRFWGGWRHWPAALRERLAGRPAAEPLPAPPRRGSE